MQREKFNRQGTSGKKTAVKKPPDSKKNLDALKKRKLQITPLP